MGHLVGFPVTLGGFKVDGEGEDGLFRYSHQIGALLFGLLAAGVQLPAVGVIGNGVITSTNWSINSGARRVPCTSNF